MNMHAAEADPAWKASVRDDRVPEKLPALDDAVRARVGG